MLISEPDLYTFSLTLLSPPPPLPRPTSLPLVVVVVVVVVAVVVIVGMVVCGVVPIWYYVVAVVTRI